MKKIKIAVISLAALLGVAVMTPTYVSADAVSDAQQGVNDIGGNDGGNAISLETRIKTIANILLFILGAIAVIMIIIGGIKYATSNGDSSSITSAKNTILYSVIGLIVALLAYAIVNFILDAF